MTLLLASSSSSIQKIPYSFIYCNQCVRVLLELYSLEDRQLRNLRSAGFSHKPRVCYYDWLKRAEIVTNAPRKVVRGICADLVDGDFVVVDGVFVSSSVD